MAAIIGGLQIDLAMAVLLSAALLLIILFQNRRSQQTLGLLARRCALAEQISEFSGELSTCPSDRLEGTIENGFREFLELAGADRVSWYVVDGYSGNLDRLCPARPVPVLSADVILSEQIPLIAKFLAGQGAVNSYSLESLPVETETERKFLSRWGIKSIIFVPRNSDARTKSTLGLSSCSAGDRWMRDLVKHLSVVASVIDAASERKKAEVASKESEERFRHLFAQASVGIALETLEGQIVHVNPVFCSMVGYAEDELLHLCCSDISHPDDVRTEQILFGELRQGFRTSYAIEKRFLRKDGSQMWSHVSVSFLRGDHGKAPLVIGMVSDITSRKGAEERLRESETRLQSTLDVLPAQIAILDEEGTIIAANAHWRRPGAGQPTSHTHLGVGSNFFEVSAATAGEKSALLQEVTKRAKSLLWGQAPGEPLVQKCEAPDGGDLWFQVMMTRFEESGRPRIVLLYQDITELMQAQDALAQNEERLSLALEASNTGTWDWDITTNKIRWRHNQNLIIGGQEKEFVGHHQQLLGLVHPEDRKCVEDVAEQAFRKGNSFSVQFRMADRQGKMHWIMAKGRITRDHKGLAVRMLGVNIDITEVKQRDQELQKLAQRLLEAQEEERRRISRELHDDIGQRVSLLACELERHRQAIAVAKLDRESGGLRRLQRQVDQLATDIHELSHELHSSKLQHCGLGAALRELCAQHSENHQLKVELSVEELNLALPSDVALCLFRVAQEALANAARHSLTRELIVRASCDSGKVRLQVKDFGVGFDPSVQSEGIGLASMRERLRIVGGTFVVRSSANEGTEIIAEVEVPDQAAAAG